MSVLKRLIKEFVVTGSQLKCAFHPIPHLINGKLTVGGVAGFECRHKKILWVEMTGRLTVQQK
jgi:hypothetical protein